MCHGGVVNENVLNSEECQSLQVYSKQCYTLSRECDSTVRLEFNTIRLTLCSQEVVLDHEDKTQHCTTAFSPPQKTASKAAKKTV